MKGVILHSGGVDSTVLLTKLLKEGHDCYPLSIEYGQRHAKEIDKAAEICGVLALDEKWQCLDLCNLRDFIHSALSGQGEIPYGHYSDEIQKATVFPNRNMILLAIAAGYAETIEGEFVAYAAHSNDRCIAEGETVVTPTGKKRVEDLVPEDEVLSCSLDNSTVSFQKVVKVVNNGTRDDVCLLTCLGGRQLRLTGNHKVFKVLRVSFNKSDGYEKTIVEVPLREIKKGDWLLTPATKKKLVTDEPVFDIDLLQYCDTSNPLLQYGDKFIWFKRDNMLPRYIKSDVFAKLVTWFVTEGNLPGPSQNNTYKTCISQKSGTPEAAEIEGLLKQWGFHYSYNEGGMFFEFSGPTCYAFRRCGRGAENKRIPGEILRMHPKLVFDTLIKGDGGEEKNYPNRLNYVTKSKVLREQVAYLCSVLGCSCSYTRNKTSGTYQMSIGTEFRKNVNRLGECKMIKVESVTNTLSARVFDITVENDHTFFAGEGSGILVSNSIYPDCRPEFVESVGKTIKLGTGGKVRLIEPFVDMTKAEVAKLGIEIGTPLYLTWSCYKGQERPCLQCGTCLERTEAFYLNHTSDPALTPEEWEQALVYLRQYTTPVDVIPDSYDVPMVEGKDY